MKKRSHRFDINRTRLRHGNKYTKYKICLSVMMYVLSDTLATFEAHS